MEKQQTTLMRLCATICIHIDQIEKSLSDKNEYLNGYKAALLNQLRLINEECLNDEKNVIINAWNDALNLNSEFLLDITSGEQYYNLLYNNQNLYK